MKVYIVGSDPLIESMFLKRGIVSTWDFDGADFVCFTGGEDVSPDLYGEKNVASSNNWLRDVEEVEEFRHAIVFGLPMVGICRGGQFLNVMNGGKMWQHVNNHAIGGTHPIDVYSYGEDGNYTGQLVYNVTSTHHQMMRAHENGKVVGKAWQATAFLHDGDDAKPICDTEIVWYPETKCLCFQPHPEYNGDKDDTEDLFFNLLVDYAITDCS